jgi:hypothetical protein
MQVSMSFYSDKKKKESKNNKLNGPIKSFLFFYKLTRCVCALYQSQVALFKLTHNEVLNCIIFWVNGYNNCVLVNCGPGLLAFGQWICFKNTLITSPTNPKNIVENSVTTCLNLEYKTSCFSFYCLIKTRHCMLSVLLAYFGIIN